MTHPRAAPWKPACLLGFCLAVPSLATVFKFGGGAGTAVYLAVVAAAMVAVVRVRAFSRPEGFGSAGLRGRMAVWGIGAALIGLVAWAFAVGYPRAQARAELGAGSDADDALNIAAARMLEWRYPYAHRTYLDQPISPMPGAVLLALPFHALGNAAYQNVFWLAIYPLVSARVLRSARSAVLLMALVLILSPAVLHQTVIGADWATNAIYVLAFMHLVMTVDPRRFPFGAAIAAIFLGLGLSSRLNFALLAPLLFAALRGRFGIRPAIRQSALAVAVAVSVTLPFYWHDPGGFSPLHTAYKLRQFDALWPHASTGVLSLAVAIGLACAMRRGAHEDVRFHLRCALIQMPPVLIGFGLSCAAAGRFEPAFLHYGVFFSMFGALSAVASLRAPPERPPAVRPAG